jgi:hypothetical protein
MRFTRLVTFTLLFCHVGQCTISTFMVFSDLSCMNLLFPNTAGGWHSGCGGAASLAIF